MPNEIYHRSNWGNANAEGFGDVYFDAAATNKLYNHSDYYENSNETDETLRDLSNKASIVLTPTAYSDGSLNTVIPPYQETLKFSGFSSFSVGSSWEVENDVATTDGLTFSNLSSPTNVAIGKKYKAVFTITGGSVRFYFGGSGDTPYTVAAGTHTLIGVAESNKVTFRNLSTASSISNFTLTEIQEADFDFSRGSSATRVNEKGLIEDVQILSGNLVQNGDFEQIGSELVTNGDFSDGTTDWTNATSDTFEVVDGGVGHSTSLHIEVSAINRGAYQSAFVADKTYYVSLDLKVVSGSVYIGKNTRKLNNQDYNNSDWQTITGYLTAIDDKIRIYGNEASEFYVDNVSVKEVGQNWSFGTGWSMGDGKVVKTSGTGSSLVQTVPTTTIGKKYKFTFDTIVTGGVANATLYGVTTPNFTTSGSQEHTITATSTSGFIFYGNDFFEGSIDNISVIEITDDTDLPRIDYTSGFGSLLLEPQSTNLITYSEDFSSLNLRDNAVVTSNEVISPSGDLDADKITFDGTLYGRVEQTITATVGQTYTISVYLKNKDLSDVTQVWIGFSQAGQGQFVTITNEWQRYSITTNANGTSEFPRIQFSGTGSLYAWGFQTENLSYATSYIPTSGSSVTRSADVANNSGNANLINSTEGVLYLEAATLVDPTSVMIIGLSDGTNANRISITFHSTLNRVQIFAQKNSVQLFNIDNTSVSKTNFNKIAISYNSTSAKFFLNGTLVASATPTDMFTANTLDRVNFDIGNGANDFYGNVKCVAVFKEALTDAELESLTSWVSFTEMATDLEYTLE